MLKTPILFIVFNRPDTTQQVFEAIRAAKPKQLFVAADGPRPDKDGEKEKCEAVREIATAVDWDCQVQTLFRDENRGCGLGPAEAITWFFENVEQGIILEDDCLPNPSFFTFCDQLLDYYKDATDIMHISGNNYQGGKKWGTGTYYFSYYIGAWGWATWRRAWNKYDFEIKNYSPLQVKKLFSNLFSSSEELKYWMSHFDLVKGGNRKDIWDYQWFFTCLYNSSKSITPNVNLVKNIGFGENATHTFNASDPTANKVTFEIGTIIHPSQLTVFKKADRHLFRKNFKQRLTLFDYGYLIKKRIKRAIGLIK